MKHYMERSATTTQLGSSTRMSGAGLTGFEAKIGKRVVVVGGCWLFNGVAGRYGQMRDVTGKKVPAHRWVYELFYGSINEAHHVHHRCENRGCINPQHLKELTPEDHRRVHADLRRERKGAA